MDWLQAVLLAILQGLTEFLPISSSAHLILPSQILGWAEQGLAFDVAVHVGSLVAVLIYFRREVADMIVAWFAWVFKGQKSADGRLAWAVIWGTFPVGLVGVLLSLTGIVDNYLRSTSVIAATTIIFALVLWWADNKAKEARDEHSLGIKDILFIGCAQAIALIPGTSRSGITMTAALMMGLTRTAAARFSFLLSIPAIVLSGGLKSYELATGEEAVDWGMIALGATVSAVAALSCIHFFLILLEKVGFKPFIFYRLALGIVLIGMMLL
ncbi:undecaprenyl-diphosphate phosphatase [Aliikangiella coralliicola]|uniref:Undecaprenyl-diphosphatase n=1 Tax=Aliikangiella coralliicola TaxID=2592383 RepID=A0A545UE41_9GAMM|nr:undecaprenyl-diphosphate phosphatase [Aliikangiella coralliicola]TQV87703.1 undecaprenyl-diphosphate phosphatase [Aliikangiella coralliicola]